MRHNYVAPDTFDEVKWTKNSGLWENYLAGYSTSDARWIYIFCLEHIL